MPLVTSKGMLLAALLGATGGACRQEDPAAAAAEKNAARWRKLSGVEEGQSVLMDTESITTTGRPQAWFRRLDETGKLKKEWRLAFVCDQREYHFIEKYAENAKGQMEKSEVSGDRKSIKPESYQEDAFKILCVNKK